MATKKKPDFPGRPTLYRGEYCQKLIDFMSTGMPYDAFAAEINVSVDILYDWEKKWPAFRQAKSIARAKQFKALSGIGLSGMIGKVQTVAEENTVTSEDSKGNKKVASKKKLVNGFNASTWIFYMKNCAGWKDNPDFSESDIVEEMDFGDEG
jgi:hypothetical protein